MSELASAALFVGLVAYSMAATLFFVDVARNEGSPPANAWAPRLLMIGAAAHAVQICLASLVTRTCPVESLPFALSLSALITVCAYMALRRRLRVHALGVAVVPIALTFFVGAQFVGQTGGSQPSGLLALHITANLVGLGLFLLAGAAGAFYLIQERRLRSKLMPSRLPALDALDRTEHRLLLAGFPLQTLGAVSGAAFIADVGTAQLAQIVFAYATWALVAGVLLLRATLGWHGRKSAYGTVLGASCVMLVLVIYIVRAQAGA